MDRTRRPPRHARDQVYPIASLDVLGVQPRRLIKALGGYYGALLGDRARSAEQGVISRKRRGHTPCLRRPSERLMWRDGRRHPLRNAWKRLGEHYEIGPPPARVQGAL